WGRCTAWCRCGAAGRLWGRTAWCRRGAAGRLSGRTASCRGGSIGGGRGGGGGSCRGGGGGGGGGGAVGRWCGGCGGGGGGGVLWWCGGEGRDRAEGGVDDVGGAVDLGADGVSDLGGCAGAVQVPAQALELDAPQRQQGGGGDLWLRVIRAHAGAASQDLGGD